jgi:hypothetical protein
MAKPKLRVVNLDHLNTLPGGQGEPHDRAVVLDTERTESHPITGQAQPVCVFRGTLAEAWAFVRQLDGLEVR